MAGGFRLLTIAPHVGAYAREVLQQQEIELEQDWIVPMMPVLYPEDCGGAEGGQGWAAEQPACARQERWAGVERPPTARTAAERRALCLQV